jgi:hypothetical protein
MSRQARPLQSHSQEGRSVHVERWAQSSAQGRTQFDAVSDRRQSTTSPSSIAASSPPTSPVRPNRPQSLHSHRSTFSSNQQRHQVASARDSYPTFMPFSDSLLLQSRWFLHGLVDANRWDIVVRLIATCVPQSYTTTFANFFKHKRPRSPRERFKIIST